MSGLLFPLVRRYARKLILGGVLPRAAALEAADNYGLTAAEGLALADELEALPSAGRETAVAFARPFDREAD